MVSDLERDNDMTLVLLEPQFIHRHVVSDRRTISQVRDILQRMETLADNQPFVLLLTFDEFVFPSQEMAVFWAKKENVPLVKAEALVIGSAGQRIIANFYLYFAKPSRPTKFFTDKNEAIAWLKEFK